MNNDIAALFARRFIQRRDVKAVQFDGGGYSPDKKLQEMDAQDGRNRMRNYGPVGFQMTHLLQHLNREVTYGHYLVDEQDMARCFCFDIDLRPNGLYIPDMPAEVDWDKIVPVEFNPRESWLDRAHPSRNWTKTQFGMLARKLCSAIQTHLGLGTAAAYSGNKGIHVYGFTGPMPAEQVRAAAQFVLEATDDWILERGQHIWKHKVPNPALGYPNMNLEVYPKQDSLENKDLGNLLRLPLGMNRKNPQDPTFFLDLRTAPGQFVPHPNPVQLLETGNPYA